MTSKNAARYRLRHRYRENLGTRLSCFGCGKKKGWTFHSFQEKEPQLDPGEIITKNMAKTARRQLGGRDLLFGEYLRRWTNLIEDELNIDAGKHGLAMFLN